MNYFDVCEMKKLVDFKDDTINANVLLKNDKNMALLIAIKENQKMNEHISETDAFVYILKGKIKYKVLQDDFREYTLSKGEVMKFEPFVKHELYGLEDSKVLVVRI